MISENKKTIVVIGNGMVGHRFCEKIVEFDVANQFRVVTFCEEPRAAYDRVGLTSFFAHRDAEKLMIARLDWYEEHGIDIHVGDRACTIDRENQIVTSERGVQIAYDYVVINEDLEECFDKVRIILHAERLKRARQTGLIDFTRTLSN